MSEFNDEIPNIITRRTDHDLHFMQRMRVDPHAGNSRHTQRNGRIGLNRVVMEEVDGWDGINGGNVE